MNYLAVMHEVHILFVDHEFNDAMNATRLLLEACQYRVTHVDLAGDAMVMLSNGKVKFDFVIADINSPDLHGFRLLQLAVSMGLPIIMLSVDDDMMMATKIIEIGAFMYMKRPTTPEMVRCLWQHVARENLRLMRERDTLMVPNYTTPRGIEFRDQHSGENPNNKGRHIEEEYDLDSNMRSRGKVKRKVCTEWTQELHDKFMNAVAQLGEGRCFPKDILELMNVPGLTRMQVASHLQKCRNDNWRSPEERKSTGGMNAMSSDGEGCGGQRPRKFGYMPRVGKYGQGSGGGQGWGGERDEGALVAHPCNSGSAFALDMDCVIQNISALPQPFADINPPRSFPLQPVYNHHQGGSMESRSQWTTTSETSNDYDTTKPNRDCTNN